MTLSNSKNGLLVEALKDQISAQAIQGLGKGHLDLAEKLGKDERNKLLAQAGTVAAGFLLPQTVSEAMKLNANSGQLAAIHPFGGYLIEQGVMLNKACNRSIAGLSFALFNIL